MILQLLLYSFVFVIAALPHKKLTMMQYKQQKHIYQSTKVIILATSDDSAAAAVLTSALFCNCCSIEQKSKPY